MKNNVQAHIYNKTIKSKRIKTVYLGDRVEETRNRGVIHR